MPIFITGKQGTERWEKLRSGVPTASRFHEIITPAQGKLSSSAKGYMAELAAARVWGVSDVHFESVHMQNGTEREPRARAGYEFLTGNKVEQVCFVYMDDQKDRACSPDGLLQPNGGIEIKSPKLKTHVEYTLSQKAPTKYKCQIQGEMYICELEWIDFISFFPGTDLFIKRVYRDEPFIKKLDTAITLFNEQLEEMVLKLAGVNNDQGQR